MSNALERPQGPVYGHDANNPAEGTGHRRCHYHAVLLPSALEIPVGETEGDGGREPPPGLGICLVVGAVEAVEVCHLIALLLPARTDNTFAKAPLHVRGDGDAGEPDAELAPQNRLSEPTRKLPFHQKQMNANVLARHGSDMGDLGKGHEQHLPCALQLLRCDSLRTIPYLSEEGLASSDQRDHQQATDEELPGRLIPDPRLT